MDLALNNLQRLIKNPTNQPGVVVFVKVAFLVKKRTVQYLGGDIH